MIKDSNERKVSKIRSFAAIVVIIIAVIGLTTLLFLRLNMVLDQYPNIVVSGKVETTGFTTSPTRIDFTSTAGNFSTPVIQGAYSISLPNRNMYQVSVAWPTATGVTSMECSNEELKLNVNASSTTYDIQCYESA